MKEVGISFKNKGQAVRGVLHLPEKKTDCALVLAHGFTGNKNGPDDVFIKLDNKLTKNGFAVLRFNFRFTNPDTWKDFEKMTIKGEVSDLKAAISYLSKKYKKIGVVGESMGGAVAVLGYNNKINCMVLWYPSIFPGETPSFKQLENREAEVVRNGYIIIEKKKFGTKRKIKIGKNFYYERKNLRVIDFIKNVKAPLLLITGNADQEVPHLQSEKAYEIANEPKKLEIIRNANHCWRNENFEPNINYQRKAIQLTVDWFKKWLE